MKALNLAFSAFLTALLLAAPLASADEHNHGDHDPPALHGMLLTGDQTLYLSHFPMIDPRSGHNYQVILEVKMVSLEEGVDAMAKYRAARNDRRDRKKLFTIAPEHF